MSAYVSMGHPGESNKRRRSEQPAALPLSEHTYGHPSSCPPLCHTSQGDADGFTLHPALSSLSQCLPSPPSHLHLSTICSILLTPSLPCYLMKSLITVFSHSRFTDFVMCVWAAWLYLCGDFELTINTSTEVVSKDKYFMAQPRPLALAHCNYTQLAWFLPL